MEQSKNIILFKDIRQLCSLRSLIEFKERIELELKEDEGKLQRTQGLLDEVKTEIERLEKGLNNGT